MSYEASGARESENESCSVVSNSLRPHGLHSPWNSPGQNTGVGSLSLLQGIFPTQGSNPGLLDCRWILFQLSHKGSPRILEWVAYPFSGRSSQPRNRTGVSCIASGFLGCHRAQGWAPCVTQQIPTGYLFYIWYCKFPCYSLHTSHPPLPSSCVHKSVLYVCFSIAALQTNSSVTSFFLDSIYMH